jgi:O-methyltransferase involved in polyketide biosynthesis
MCDESENTMTKEAPNINTFAVARGRYEEDELAAAVASGATQYVVLGAGPNRSAFRKVDPRLRVFEVDHHAAENQSISSALKNSDFRAEEISFFSWLGATLYRTAEAAIETLAFIGSLPTGSRVVFDYAVERSSLDSVKQMALDALASRIERAGEPFRLFLNPTALYGLLRAAGFHRIDDLGPEEIDNRYLADGTEDLRMGAGVAHFVSARV